MASSCQPLRIRYLGVWDTVWCAGRAQITSRFPAFSTRSTSFTIRISAAWWNPHAMPLRLMRKDAPMNRVCGAISMSSIKLRKRTGEAKDQLTGRSGFPVITARSGAEATSRITRALHCSGSLLGSTISGTDIQARRAQGHSRGDRSSRLPCQFHEIRIQPEPLVDVEAPPLRSGPEGGIVGVGPAPAGGSRRKSPGESALSTGTAFPASFPPETSRFRSSRQGPHICAERAVPTDGRREGTPGAPPSLRATRKSIVARIRAISLRSAWTISQ